MTTHEIPDWEPTTTSPPKQPNFFNKPPIRKPLPSASAKVEGLVSSASAKEEGERASSGDEFSPPTKRSLSDRYIPRLLGRDKRKWIGACGVLLILLILIIGLAVGLKKHKLKSQNLPLPTNNGIFTGDLTYYSPGPGYGACGYENTSEDSICAVSHIIWDAASTSSNPNNNPLCGKKIRITRFDPTVGGNRSVDVEVVDRCVGCKSTDLDLSMKMFTSLAEEVQGRVVGSWAWLT